MSSCYCARVAFPPRRAVELVVFDFAFFKILSQDHLDFHRDMEDYYRAKRSMLTPAHARRAVVCVDGDWGRRLAREAEVPVVTYATDPAAGADHTARDLRADGYGTVFTADGPRGSRTLRSALDRKSTRLNSSHVAIS